ncbi:VOC family protein [Deinococcus sp. HMF7620]|uniref:VOC family protein n=1 Tax=Deinococcus arboris TaxID=2682977 RepID=A0A7C9MRD4_9DEIO|nr:VOC family protein [Deinococcus arboris]MVN87084.1 VOC family protein [Deinococcus arboris]
MSHSVALSPTLHLRLARPSRNLAAAQHFYQDGLGLQVLWQSCGDGFADLLMLGLPGAAWHLELTHARDQTVTPTPTAEDLLVLYLDGPVPAEVIQCLEQCGGQRVAALNPYWDEWGVTVQDPDGYRLVLCTRSWPKLPPAT